MHLILLIFSGIGLWWISNGRFFFVWELTSWWACKLRWFFEVWPEIVSDWSVALLSGERFFALYFPMQHLRHDRLRTTKILLLAILPFGVLVVSQSVWYTQPMTFWGNIQLCHPLIFGISVIAFALFTAVFSFGMYIYPYTLSLTFTLCIIIKLVFLSRAERSANIRVMSQVSTSIKSLKVSRRDRHAGFTIVILILAELVIYAPLTASYCTVFTLQMVAPIATQQVQALLTNFSFTLFKLTTVKRFSNFYIYLLRLPSTRRKLFCRK